MAVYRQIHTSFWQDEFVLNLTPEEKYFYLFLLTNSKTKQCGIYQLPVQVIVFETGYNQETVEKLLKRFIDYGKIIYSVKTREIGIINWPKYNSMESPKVRACVLRELKEVKDKSLIDKIYPMDRVSQKEQEQEEEKEKTTTEVPATGSSGSGPISEKRELIEPEGNDYDYSCHSLIDQSLMLFTRIWNKTSTTPEEQRLVSEYIITYGLNEVELAFREAVKHNNRKLAYVEGICKKRQEKAAIEKSKEEARQKKLEQDKLLRNQRQSGTNLNLIEMVYGSKKTNLSSNSSLSQSENSV
jgi:hypothetical protein